VVEVGVGEGSREGEVGVDGVGLNGSTGARVVEEGDEEGSNMYWAIHAGGRRCRCNLRSGRTVEEVPEIALCVHINSAPWLSSSEGGCCSIEKHRTTVRSLLEP